MRGLFCVDPGGSTGIAWAIIDESQRTAIEAMKNRLHRDSMTITGNEEKQVRELFRLWESFKRLAVETCLLEPKQVEPVFEDFILRGGPVVAGRVGTMPERISWGFEGYRMGRFDQWRRNHKKAHYSPIVWQQPGAAARFGNKDILKEAEAWIKGKPHERSAYSHMIYRINILMDNRRYAN
jgi:hypothetical protein